jgi:hypothetical protein
MPLEPASISISIISLQLNMVVSLPNALHRRGAAGHGQWSGSCYLPACSWSASWTCPCERRTQENRGAIVRGSERMRWKGSAGRA